MTRRSGAAARPIQRVLFVLQSTAIGGMETHCVDLVAEYARRGIEIHVVLPRAASLDPLVDRFRSGGASVLRITTDARAGRTAQLSGLIAYGRLIRQLRPDVVHLQTGGATGGLAPIAIARVIGDAVVAITEHDVPAPSPGRVQRVARFVMDRCAHLIISVSRRNAKLRRERIAPPERKFVSILNGVPLPDVTPDMRARNREVARRELGINANAVVLGSLVRLAEGKGLDDLLRAFAIARRDVAFELLLVGDGPLRDELGDLADELGIGVHTHFAGHQDNPERFLDAMDAFVLPVPVGSMSIALLEAMARGLAPIITFCGPEEAVVPDETGLCAPPLDPDGLATALVRMVRDAPLRAKLATAAAAHVRDHYSVGRVASDTVAAYEAAEAGAMPARLLASAPADASPGEHYLRTG